MFPTQNSAVDIDWHANCHVVLKRDYERKNMNTFLTKVARTALRRVGAKKICLYYDIDRTNNVACVNDVSAVDDSMLLIPAALK